MVRSLPMQARQNIAMARPGVPQRSQQTTTTLNSLKNRTKVVSGALGEAQEAPLSDWRRDACSP